MAFGRYSFGQEPFGGVPAPIDVAVTLEGVEATGTPGGVTITTEHNALVYIDGVEANAALGILTPGLPGSAFINLVLDPVYAERGVLSVQAQRSAYAPLLPVHADGEVGALEAEAFRAIDVALVPVRARTLVGQITVEIINPDAFVYLERWRVSAQGVAGELDAHAGWVEELDNPTIWEPDSRSCN